MSNEWQCPQCGAHNPPTAKYCGDCATPAGAVRSAAPATGPVNGGGGMDPLNAGPRSVEPAAPQPVYVGRAGGAAGPVVAAAWTGERKYNNFGMYAIGLGALSLVCCGPVSGIPGIMMAKMQMDAIKRGESAPEQLGMAKMGFWVAIVGTVLGTCGILAAMVMMMMGGLRGM